MIKFFKASTQVMMKETVWFLLIIGLHLATSAKKSSKMKDLLREESQKTVLKTPKANTTPETPQKECYKCSSGFHTGSKIHPMNFEYKGKHGWMTSKEAEDNCEADLACGGFAFYGVDAPNRHHFIFFVHYVPVHGIKKPLYETDLLWTFYRTYKKIIVLPGRPHIMHRKIKSIKTTPEILDGVKLAQIQSWPYSPDLLSVSYKLDGSDVIGQKRFQFSDHNFKDSQWRTIINHDTSSQETASAIIDGSTWGLHKSCKSYEKPLLNIDLRFHPDLHSNIQELDCRAGIDKETFESEIVRKKVPVVLKGCQTKIDGIEDVHWEGSALMGDEGKQQQQKLQMLSYDQIDKLRKNHAVLNVKGKIATFQMKEPFVPIDLDGELDNEEFLVSLKTKGKGQVLTIDGTRDTFNVQVDGVKWWTIFPSGLTSSAMFQCSYDDDDIKYWKASAWFNAIQPQLYFTEYFGKPVIHAMQHPGDILYLPSNSLFSTYAVEDSLDVAKHIKTVGTIDTSKPDITKLVNLSDKAIVRQRQQLSREWAEIQQKSTEINAATMFG